MCISLDFSHFTFVLLIVWRSPVLFLLLPSLPVSHSLSLSLSPCLSLSFSVCLSLSFTPPASLSLSLYLPLSSTFAGQGLHFFLSLCLPPSLTLIVVLSLTFTFSFSFPFIQGDLLIALSTFLVPNPKYISPTARAISMKPARMTIEVASRMYVHLFFFFIYLNGGHLERYDKFIGIGVIWRDRM